MKTSDKLYIGALIGIMYIIGVVGGMSNCYVSLASGLVRCAIAVAVTASLTALGAKFERAKH